MAHSIYTLLNTVSGHEANSNSGTTKWVQRSRAGAETWRGLRDGLPKKFEVGGRPMHWSAQYLEK